jgi:SAM-dependent methyltransferase
MEQNNKMKDRNKTKISGKEFYDNIYKDDLKLEIEWLRRGAKDKVNSIEMLLNNNNIKVNRVLELGCGTGAVITECQKRNLAKEYYGLDYSSEAISFLEGNSKDIQLATADITSENIPFQNIFFDLIVLSHVVEHLEDPQEFLQNVHKKFDFEWILIEVPLEDLFFSRLKARFRSRYKNRAGHVQFFTPSSFEALIKNSGFDIVDKRIYVPIAAKDTVKFICMKNKNTKPIYFIKLFTLHYLPSWFNKFWSKFYIANQAVLCKKYNLETI